MTDHEGKPRRKRGTGTYEDLGDGRVQYRRKGVVCADGVTRTITGTGRTREEAYERFLENRHKRQTGTASSRTLGSVVRDWEARSETNRATSKETVTSAMRSTIYPRLPASTPLSKIDHRTIEKLIDRLKAETSPATTHNAYGHLRTVLSHALRRRWITTHPMHAIPEPPYRPSTADADERYISRREGLYKGLLKELKAKNDPTYYWVLFLSLGLRRGEICGLTWGDVSNLGDASKTKLRVQSQFYERPNRISPITKSGRSREIPLPRPYVLALREWKSMWQEPAQEWAKGQIFARPNPQRGGANGLTAQRLYKVWGDALRAYVEKGGEREDYQEKWYFSPHKVRHISASMMSDLGVPIGTAMAILGHSSEEMTRWYTHAGSDAKRDAVRDLASKLDILESPPGPTKNAPESP